MKRNQSARMICIAALLNAIGILIPLVMPIKLVIPPASFTLASHVPVFLAMMISPAVALAVAIGTTLGFFLGGFPPVIVLRAASHIVFALLGAFYLKKNPAILDTAALPLRAFSLLIGLLHAVCEVFVVAAFYFGGHMTQAYYQSGFLHSILLLVGLGTVIHSMVDFEIAQMAARLLRKQRGLDSLFLATHKNL